MIEKDNNKKEMRTEVGINGVNKKNFSTKNNEHFLDNQIINKSKYLLFFFQLINILSILFTKHCSNIPKRHLP